MTVKQIRIGVVIACLISIVLAILIAVIARAGFNMPLPDGMPKPGIDVSQPDQNPFAEMQDCITVNEMGDEPLIEWGIDVDWDRVKNIYPNVIGWIYCPYTAINAPILKFSSKEDVASDENLFYVVDDGDATMTNENVIVYASNFDFSKFNDMDYVFGENYKGGTAIILTNGNRYYGDFWAISPELKKFGSFDVEKRTFKNLFEKNDWINAAFDSQRPELLDTEVPAPEDIEPLLTVISSGGGGNTVLYAIKPAE